jgi:putative Holliday junction resolvase
MIAKKAPFAIFLRYTLRVIRYTIPMRYLGIDYGAKRVGVAVSNETNEFALPLAVLQNDDSLIPAIKKIVAEKEIGQIVLGESTNFKGEPNEIMKRIGPFKKELESAAGLPVYFEPEFYSSAEAERIQGKTKSLDASAAAIILRSYLDKKTNNVAS